MCYLIFTLNNAPNKRLIVPFPFTYIFLFYFFYRYLDRYRDVKDLNEEVLKDKLKDINPLEPPPEKQKYPLLNLIRYNQLEGIKPSWLKPKLRHKYLKEMHWKESDETN